jgi:branched-chain amino acid transport system substrate-binding protein
MANRLFLYPIAAVVAVCALTLTAPLSSASAAESAKASLSPVKVMDITVLNGTITSFPEIPAAVEAAAKQINAEGGLNGHPVQVITCNDQGDVNTDEQCAEQAVSDGVIAAVGSYSSDSNVWYPIFAKTGIINLAESTLANSVDFTSPLAYPITAGTAVEFTANGVLAAREGCKKFAVLSPDTPLVLATLHGSLVGADSVNKKITDNVISVAYPVTDYAPLISQAVAAGDNCIIGATPGSDAVRLMTAIQQSGHPFKVFGIAAQFPPADLTGSLGSFSNGKIFVTTPQAVANSNPAMVKITKAIKAENSSATLDDESLQAWAGMQTLKLASAHMTTYTSKALAAALAKTGTISLGYYAPFSFSKPLNVPGYNRMFNLGLYGEKFENGQFVPVANPNPEINIRNLVAAGLSGTS